MQAQSNPTSSVDQDIFRLAWPNIISNVSIPLLSSVDTALMGSLSPLHLGAVGLGAMIFNFFYWNFGFLRMGTTGMTAQAWGRKDWEETTVVFWRAIMVAICLGLMLILLQYPLAQLGIWAMRADEGLSPLVSSYVLIRIWAAPATFSLFVLFGWSFGMQDAKKPMYTAILINVINIIVSYILIVHYDYGIAGVAWGTVIAQYIGVLTIVLLLKKEHSRVLSIPNWPSVLDRAAIFKFFSINSDIFLRTVCLTIVFGFFYSQSSAYGELILGLNVVLQQFLNWMSYGVDGFAYAAESVVGKWFGAKNEFMVRKSISRSFLWGGVAAGIFSLIYLISGEYLFSVFTKDPAIQALASEYLWWVVILPIVGFASYIWDGAFIGMTAAKSMRQSMLWSLITFGLSFWLFEESLGFEALWLALSIFLITRAIVQWWMFYRSGMDLK